MSTKLTLKNAMVYDFMVKNYDPEQMATSVKAIFHANKDEIARRFGITTYATFNMHVRKCREWETKTGNKVNVIRMDNEGVL